MRLRQLFTHSDLLEMAASSGGGAPGPGPGGPPSSPPSTPVPTLASTARVGDAPPGGGAGLSGQGNFKPANGIFIGKSPAEERHDYTAKSVIGKGIEWPKPNGAAQDSVVHKDDELETHDTHVGDDHHAVSEDADASSTSTADIATVSYPLFVNGATRRAKRRNARRAVGQKPVTSPSYIGRGVYESIVKDVKEGSLNEFAPVGRGPWGDDDSGEDPYKRPEPKHYSRSIDFFGKFEGDHFDREDMNDATGEFKGHWGKDQIAYFKFDNPRRTGSDDPGMGWYYEPNTDSDSNNTKATPAVDNSAQRKQQELGMIRAFLKSGQTPKPGSQIYSLMKRHGVAEAHVLNHDNVIYRLDRDNPMSDTEVAVIGGAGRYSLSGLRDKARKEAKALSDDLASDHGGSFRGAAYNIKQLTNTLNTIVAAYNELKRIRGRGGRGSRGITDEDTNFIRECMTVVEQWHTIQGKK